MKEVEEAFGLDPDRHIGTGIEGEGGLDTGCIGEGEVGSGEEEGL